MRLAALCALIVVWIGPVREGLELAQAPARLAVILDTSQSMSLPVGEDGKTRVTEARGAAEGLARILAGAETPPRIEWIGFAQRLEAVAGPGALKANGQATDLRCALRELACESEETAAALFSDGADTEGARAAALVGMARAAGLRLTTVSVGQDAVLRDVAVDFLTAPRRVRANSEFELSAVVRSLGYAGQELQAEVLREKRRVREVAVEAGAAGKAVKVSLRAGSPGRYRYTLRIPPEPGETSTANNARSVLVEVVPDKPTVLVISGAPSVEYAFIKRALLSDKGLRARLVVCKAHPRVFWRDDASPKKTSIEAVGDLRRVDAVLLQDLPLAGLEDLSAKLARFVRRGGGLAALGGPGSFSGYAASALGAVLPAQIGSGEYVDEIARPQLGLANQSLARALELANIPFASLVPLRGRNMLASAKSGASVDLSAGGAPLLTSWQVGRGRALVLATDSTHRWAFNPSAGEREQRAFEDFWAALVAWLTEVRDDRPVVAEFDREQYQAGEPARLLVQVTDAHFQPVTEALVIAKVEEPRGGLERVVCAPAQGQPGRYEAVMPTEAAGALRVAVVATHQGRRLGSDKAGASVAPSLVELAEGRCDVRLLEAIGEGSGGAYLALADCATLPERVAVEPTAVERPVQWRLARGPWALALLLALWAVDWGLRRRWQGA